MNAPALTSPDGYGEQTRTRYASRPSAPAGDPRGRHRGRRHRHGHRHRPGTGGTATREATHEATRAATVQLAMFTGVFNLLWATVTVLMIVRPGSTTGA
ncbi:hypothetical protein ABZ137_21090 [Streptomyces bobili]|uniref:hypothetical protein n=1 Tax=Streptomyces bobili TaxID=67280 RepID=UPI0033B1B33C